MWDILYPIIVVLIGSIFIFFAGWTVGTVFFGKSRAWAQIHPRSTRWIAAGLVMLVFFLAVKFLAPFYKGFIAGTGFLLFIWGVLSRIEKRIVWKEILTRSFWVPEEPFRSRFAKNGL